MYRKISKNDIAILKTIAKKLTDKSSRKISIKDFLKINNIYKFISPNAQEHIYS